MSYGERLDPPCNPQLDAAWEHHIETCENCLSLASVQHLPICRNCDHEWHIGGQCTAQEQDGSRACDCPETDSLAEGQISDMQARCFREETEHLTDNAAEAKFQARRDGNRS